MNSTQTVRPKRIGFTVLVLLAALAGSAAGQSLSSSNIFAGYSFTGANLYTGEHANLNGWNIAAEKKFLAFFGVVADFSGHYGSTTTPSSTCGSQAGCVVSSSVSEHFFQAGIRGGYPTGRVRPYAEFLLGAVRTVESGADISNAKNTFEETLAAGLDFRVARRWAWRLEAGYVKTGSFVAQQNSLRASTGAVFLF